MATLKISHSYLEDLQSEGKAFIEGASALNRLFDKEEARLKREDEASILRAVYRTIVEQLQWLRRIETSASCGHNQASAVLFVAELAATAIVAQGNRASAIKDYLVRKATDEREPFGLVVICIGPKGLPDDAKAISISQSARDSNRLEREIVSRLHENGFLLFSEEAFSSLIDKLTADVRQEKLCLPISRERLREIVGLNKPKSRIKVVPIE